MFALRHWMRLLVVGLLLAIVASIGGTVARGRTVQDAASAAVSEPAVGASPSVVSAVRELTAIPVGNVPSVEALTAADLPKVDISRLVAPYRFPVFPIDDVEVAPIEADGVSGSAVRIAASEDAWFVAPTSGYVQLVIDEDRWDADIDDPITRDGIVVSIRGDDGYRYYGGHLSEVADGIEQGVRVAPGTPLGRLGSTGLTLGSSPRLRFAVSKKVSGTDIQPFPLLAAWKLGYPTASPGDAEYVFPVSGTRTTSFATGGPASKTIDITSASGGNFVAPIDGVVESIQDVNRWKLPEPVVLPEPAAPSEPELDAEGNPIEAPPATAPPVTAPPAPEPIVQEPGAEEGRWVTIVGADGWRYRGSRLGPLAAGIQVGASVTAGQKLASLGTSGDAVGGIPRVQIRISEGSEDTSETRITPKPLLEFWKRGINRLAPAAYAQVREDETNYAVPVREPMQFGPGGHSYAATDLFAEVGTEYFAIVDGVLGAVSFRDRYDADGPLTGTKGGLFVYLHGDDGFRYYGSHFLSLGDGIEPGMRVKQGQLIGLVGVTGNAGGTPPHVHWEIARTSDAMDRRGQIDPADVLDAWLNGNGDRRPDGTDFEYENAPPVELDRREAEDADRDESDADAGASNDDDVADTDDDRSVNPYDPFPAARSSSTDGDVETGDAADGDADNDGSDLFPAARPSSDDADDEADDDGADDDEPDDGESDPFPAARSSSDDDADPADIFDFGF